jgi:hypothetical protein
MHSMGMYLGLQGTRILAGFLRVAAAKSARSVDALARGWSHGMCFFVECLGRRGGCACSGLERGECNAVRGGGHDPGVRRPGAGLGQSPARTKIFPADTEIAERGRSVLVMRARYRSAGLIPHQRGWTDAG